MITGGNKITGVSTTPVQMYAPRKISKNNSVRERAVPERFDSVTISGERNSFEAQLAGRIGGEVRATATPGRLSALSQQIASGEYQPDAMSIARRMLLLPEE